MRGTQTSNALRAARCSGVREEKGRRESPNGKPLSKCWFYRSEIMNGGKLELVMGPEPNKSWGSAPEDAPPSMIDEDEGRAK